MANDAVQLEFLLAGLRDTSGNPLVGGKVHTYAAGTSTDKIMWVDADQVGEATNPIILDGNGQAEIFADGLYNVTVKDANDVTLYTWEFLEFQKGFRTTAETVEGVKTFSDGIKTDTIDEATGGAGVTVDGVLLKDNEVYADAVIEKTTGSGVTLDDVASSTDAVRVKDKVLETDNITERQTAAGVTIEGVLIKDFEVVTDVVAEQTPANGVSVDGLNIKDSKLNTDDSVVTSNITDGAVTPAKLYYWIAGDTLYNSNDTQVNTTSDTYVKVKETQVPRGGTYRVKFRMWRGSGGTAYATIYKNGVAYGTERSTSAASPGVTFSEDLAFEPDDLIQIYFRRSATYTMSLADFRLYIGTDQQDPINTLT